MTCSRCAAAVPPGARFCMACGAACTAAAGPGPGDHAPERIRFITVVFCDIAGSTELAGALSPDVWGAILARYFDNATRIVSAERGRVEKFIGDAVVAVFGTDAADEDDAVRAVRAGIALRDWIRAEGELLERSRGIAFAGRLGIASGQAALAPGRDSSFAIGAVLNRAARLQSAGGIGDIVVDARTWLLVRSTVPTAALGAVPAKGFQGGLRAWRVGDGGDGVPADPEPTFVGRADLVATLVERLHTGLTGGEPAVVLVSGDAGIGKSRLLDRCWERIGGDGAGVRAGRVALRCTERDGSHHGLRSLLLLESLIRATAAGDAAPGGTAADVTTATRTLAEVHWQLRADLGALAADSPLLLLVEDIQWAAGPLLDFLADLALRPVPSVALAVTGQTVPDVPALTARAVHVRVPPLPAEDCRSLVEAVAGDVEVHGSTAVEEMIRVSRGNPLYLTQVLTLAAEADGAGDLFPPSAEAVIGARVDRLPVPAQRLLAVLGAFGAPAAEADLAAVAPVLGLAVDEALGDLIHHRFAAVDDASVAGRLPVAADVAYRRLRLVDRAAVHTRIATVLGARVGREPAVAELVAHHAVTAYRAWERSDPGAGAANRAGVAAGRALCDAARFAILHSEVPLALRHLDLAKSVAGGGSTVEIAAVEAYARLVTGLPAAALAVADAALSTMDTEGNGAAVADLMLTTALTRAMVTGERDDALLVRARTLAHDSGDPAAVSRALLFEAFDAMATGDYPTAQRTLSRSAEHARRATACLSAADTYGNLALCLAYGDEPAAAALSVCTDLVNGAGAAQALRAALSCPRAHLLHMVGRTDEAAAAIAEAYATCERIGHRPGLAGVLMFRAGLAEREGDLPRAAADLVAMARLCDEIGLGDAARAARLRHDLLALLGASRPLGSASGGGTGWAETVLAAQVLALRTRSPEPLSAAWDVLASVRGHGAVLLPLLTGVRVARELGADAPADRWRVALDAAARAKGDVVLASIPATYPLKSGE